MGGINGILMGVYAVVMIAKLKWPKRNVLQNKDKRRTPTNNG